MTTTGVRVSRLFGVVSLFMLAAFGLLLVGAAVADIVWREEPNLAMEWTVVVVAAAVAFTAVVRAVSQRRRSGSAGAESRHNGMSE